MPRAIRKLMLARGYQPGSTAPDPARTTKNGYAAAKKTRRQSRKQANPNE
jgi:hypothetical protein